MIQNLQNGLGMVSMIWPSKLKQFSTAYLSSIIQSDKKKGFEERAKSFNLRQSFKETSNPILSQSVLQPKKCKQQVRLAEFDSKINLNSFRRGSFKQGNNFYLSDIADEQYQKQRSQSHRINLRKQDQGVRRKMYACNKLEFKSFVERQQSRSKPVVLVQKLPHQIVYNKQSLNSWEIDSISQRNILGSVDNKRH